MKFGKAMIIEENSNRKLKICSKAPNEAEIERLMLENGVEPFNFDEAVGEGANLWTDEEFEEFLVWLRESRRNSNRRKEKID